MADTVKGGKYIVGSNFVDANGNVLGPVKKEAEPKPAPKVVKPSSKK